MQFMRAYRQFPRLARAYRQNLVPSWTRGFASASQVCLVVELLVISNSLPHLVDCQGGP